MCKHAGYRKTAEKFADKTIVNVVEQHKMTVHCDVKAHQAHGKERWVKHAAYKTIIRQEARRRGLGT